MARKHYTPEQIIRILRESEVLISQGKTAVEAARQTGVTEQTYYRWRKEYGGMRTDQAKRLKFLEKQNLRLKRIVADKELDNQILRETLNLESKKLLSPAKRRKVIDHVCNKIKVSVRRACKALGISRSSYNYVPVSNPSDEILITRMVELALEYGRYGYRRIAALLRVEGFQVNHKKIERLWRKEGLKVPQRQPKRRRLWFNDGSCLRLRPLYPNHVWSYDFVATRTEDGQPL